MHTINLKLLLFLVPIILNAGTINESLIEYVCIDPIAENYFERLDPDSNTWDSSNLNPNSDNYSEFIAQNYEVDNSTCVYEATLVCQNIHLNEGWNMISTYIAYTYPIVDAEGFYETVLDNFIISKSNTGMAYIPTWNYNGIGNFEPGKGYQIKMNSEQVLLYDAND